MKGNFALVVLMPLLIAVPLAFFALQQYKEETDLQRGNPWPGFSFEALCLSAEKNGVSEFEVLAVNDERIGTDSHTACTVLWPLPRGGARVIRVLVPAHEIVREYAVADNTKLTLVLRKGKPVLRMPHEDIDMVFPQGRPQGS